MLASTTDSLKQITFDYLVYELLSLCCFTVSKAWGKWTGSEKDWGIKFAKILESVKCNRSKAF